MHEDAVQVGVFLKADRKLAELRPKSKWLSCTLYLPHAIDDPRVARSLRLSSIRVISEVKLRVVDDVDEPASYAWLTEAYDVATGEQ